MNNILSLQPYHSNSCLFLFALCNIAAIVTGVCEQSYYRNGCADARWRHSSSIKTRYIL